MEMQWLTQSVTFLVTSTVKGESFNLGQDQIWPNKLHPHVLLLQAPVINAAFFR